MCESARFRRPKLRVDPLLPLTVPILLVPPFFPAKFALPSTLTYSISLARFIRLSFPFPNLRSRPKLVVAPVDYEDPPNSVFPIPTLPPISIIPPPDDYGLKLKFGW